MNSPLLPPQLRDLGSRELFVSEFFLSVQGESTHAGRPCFFIRLCGCHLRCTWCDSEYAFFDGSIHTVDDCLNQAHSAGCNLVEVTGGEPLLQKAVYPLLTELCEEGYEVLLETSGAVPIDRVDPRVRRIVDWKAPGSGMEQHNRSQVLQNLRAGDELKLVLNDRTDYEWAREWLRQARKRVPSIVPILFSPVFGSLDPRELLAWIHEDKLPVRLNLQLHKVLWSPQTRGV